MKMKSFMAVFMGICLMLACACGQGTENAVIEKASDVVPQIKEEGSRMGFLIMSVTRLGDTFAVCTDDQAARGLELLDKYQLKDMEQSENFLKESGGFSGGSSIYVKWAEDGCRIDHRFLQKEDTFGLAFTFDSGKAFYFKGEIAAVPELKELYDEVMGAYASGVTVESPIGGDKRDCTVQNIAEALDILEYCAAKDPVAAEGECDFTCRVTVDNADFLIDTGNEYALTVDGGTVYSIDFENSLFQKEGPDGTAYYSLEGSETGLKIALGLN